MSTEISPVVLSGDLDNMVRDLREEFTTVLGMGSGLLSLLAEEDREFYGDGGKLQWLEDVEERETDTLDNGAAVLAADTSFGVSNVGRFYINMIIKFRDHDETMRITAVDHGASTLTVVREENGISAPTTVADGSDIDIVSRPVMEYNRANEVTAYEPTIEYNYYETFREDLPFSERVANSRMFGFRTGDDFIDYNVERWLRRLRSRLARAIVWGERNVGGSSSPSRMRGAYTWLRQTGTNKSDATGAALTSTMVNNLLESIYLDDGDMRDLVLYMDTVQARKMAQFNTHVANRMETVDFDSRIASGATGVTLFHSDLEPVGMPTIVVDKEAPKGAVMALNVRKMRLVYGPKGRLVEWDSKPKDLPPDAQRRGLIMTCSLLMQDHKYSHGLIYNAKKTL